MIAYQGYAKLAIHEGFQDFPLPSVAGRAALSHVTGTDQVRLDIASLDVLASKPFGVAGTFRAEPFGGWSYLMIKAKNAMPGCDRFLTGSDPNVAPVCSVAGPAPGADPLFPAQDTIIRNRFFGGIKLKFAVVFLAAQYEYFPPGNSRDRAKAGAISTRDDSAKQTRVSLSGGFDF